MGKLKDTLCDDPRVSHYDHELRSQVETWEFPERRDHLLLEFTVEQMMAHARIAQVDMRVTRETHDEEFFHGLEWIVFGGDLSGGFLLSDITPPHEAYQYMLDELDQKLKSVLREAAGEIERRVHKFMQDTTFDAIEAVIEQGRRR